MAKSRRPARPAEQALTAKAFTQARVQAFLLASGHKPAGVDKELTAKTHARPAEILPGLLKLHRQSTAQYRAAAGALV